MTGGSEREFADIRLRAIRKIDEISRDLEKAHRTGDGKAQLLADGKLPKGRAIGCCRHLD
jgi:hypothetical protein